MIDGSSDNNPSQPQGLSPALPAASPATAPTPSAAFHPGALLSSDSADSPKESTLGRMGIRALLVLLLVGTVCLISVLDAVACYRQAADIEINPSLLSLASLAAGFYFGQKTQGVKA